MLINRLRRFSSDVVVESWMKTQPEPSVNFISLKTSKYAKNYDLEAVPDIYLADSPYEAPTIKHGLSKIIRTEGIYPAEQFSEFLQKVPPINSDIFSRLSTYVRPSKDKVLLEKAKENNVNYFSGSSSLTEAFQQIYYAITNFKSPDMTGLGEEYNQVKMNYMSAYRKPSMIFLRRQEGNIYSVESDKGPIQKKNMDVLLKGGIIIEGLFTNEEDFFNRVCDLNTPLSEEDQKMIYMGSKSFRYRKIGKLLIRSQIDCQELDELGNPFVYEIKTRACSPIRYDLENYEKYLDYKIVSRNGTTQSYELEYFDLIRSILLKYFFQIKIGRMDGAFIAYHNTQKFFGYEYISLAEIEKRLFGCPEISNQVLKICATILQDILDDIVRDFSEYDFIKVGLFSNFYTKEIMIVVEPHDKEFDYPYDTRITDKINDEIDYYKMFHPNVTPYVYSRKIFPVINGILQNEPVFLESGDQYTFKQIKYANGSMDFEDYMNFLLYAYKSDSIITDNLYSGYWSKTNDFHVFRKPIYKTYF